MSRHIQHSQHSGGDYEEETDRAEPFDFLRFYYALKERVWMVVLCVVAAGFVTFGYLKRSPDIYVSTTILQVELEQPKILNIQDLAPVERGPEAIKSVERLLRSRGLLERVVLTNNLAGDERFVGKGGGEPPGMEKLIKRLMGMTSVSASYGTRLLTLTVESEHRDLTIDVSNWLVEQFHQQNYEQHLAAVESATRLLSAEEVNLRAKVEESEKAVQAYRETKNLVSLEGGQDIVVQELKDAKENLGRASASLVELQGEYQQVTNRAGDVRALLQVRSIRNDPAVALAMGRLAEQEVFIGNMKATYKAKHPIYITAINEWITWQTSLSNATLTAAVALRNAYLNALNTETNFQAKLKEAENKVFDLERASIEYRNLVRDAKGNRDMYESILARKKEAVVSKNWDQNKLSVLQPAYVPQAPSKPDKQHIMMLGLLLGFGVGISLALGLELLDSTLKTPDQAEAALNLPILTAVPRIRSVERGRKNVVMLPNGEPTAAEAFRTLRTTLAMLEAHGTRRTFLFTSAVPGEGKTFGALNFAYSLAQQGLRTLLIEADLRCPTVAEVLPFQVQPSPGLSDYLSNNANFNQVVQQTNVRDLSCIVAGTRVNNPSELLGQEGFTALLQEALLHFDRVIVDSAPVQPVSDTLLLVNKVQAVCLVVCADRALRKATQRAVTLLLNTGAPLAGIVFNRLSHTRGQHYHDYTYYPEYVETTTGP